MPVAPPPEGRNDRPARNDVCHYAPLHGLGLHRASAPVFPIAAAVPASGSLHWPDRLARRLAHVALGAEGLADLVAREPARCARAASDRTESILTQRPAPRDAMLPDPVVGIAGTRSLWRLALSPAAGLLEMTAARGLPLEASVADAEAMGRDA